MGMIPLAHTPTPAERLKDTVWAASVVLLFGIPMLGLTTVDEGGKLVVVTRWPLLAGAVAIAGRFTFRRLVKARKASHRRIACSPGTVCSRIYTSARA